MLNGMMGAFLEKLAGPSGTPGGGAAAGLAGAQGCALLSMVGELSVNKKNLAEHQAEHQELIRAFTKYRQDFLELSERDIVAFEEVMKCWKSKDTGALEVATIAAAQVALEMAQLCDVLWAQVDRLCVIGNTQVLSDVACAHYQLFCCFNSSIVNVMVNANTLNPEARASLNIASAELKKRAIEWDQKLQDQFHQFDPKH